jgi:uncharacterized membrane-anchored protein
VIIQYIKAKNNERKKEKEKREKLKKGKQKKNKIKGKKGEAEASAVSNLQPPAYSALTCKNRGKIKE